MYLYNESYIPPFLCFEFDDSENMYMSSLAQVIGTLCVLFTLSPQLAPVLGLLMLTVSAVVGKIVL